MQTVVAFCCGVTKDGSINNIPIETQINNYISKNPTHSVRTLSTIIAGGYKEAFVVFDIREGRDEKKPYNEKPKENKKYGGNQNN